MKDAAFCICKNLMQKKQHLLIHPVLFQPPKYPDNVAHSAHTLNFEAPDTNSSSFNFNWFVWSVPWAWHATEFERQPEGWRGREQSHFLPRGRLGLSNPQIVSATQQLLLCPFHRRSGTLAAANLQTFFFFPSLPLFLWFTPPTTTAPWPPVACSLVATLAPSTDQTEEA